MNILFLAWQIFQWILWGYFLFFILYLTIFAIAGLFYKQYKKEADLFRRFAVFIPSYKEDNVIIDVAKNALIQDYPSEYFDVIVIADSLKSETIEKLKNIPVNVIEVSFDISTKAKALNQALSILPENKYDIALILDADNIMEFSFISKINATFTKGIPAVQGHRTAKNLNNSFAILDAISEEINNHIFRKGRRALGLSSAIIGSGMAFEYLFFKDLMKSAKAIGGFDKEIELEMLSNKLKIDYADHALVFDEKVQKPEVFQNQRKRWLSAQFHYFGLYILPATKKLILNQNIDFFDKALQMLQPPRILLLGLVFLFTTISIIINPIEITYYWFAIFFLCLLTLLISVPAKHYNKKTLNAFFTLPKAFSIMLLSLFKLKGANKKFIHTEHTTTNTL